MEIKRIVSCQEVSETSIGTNKLCMMPQTCYPWEMMVEDHGGSQFKTGPSKSMNLAPKITKRKKLMA
jgi:hypothetical protein